MKKIIALLLAVVMVCSMSITAFAATEPMTMSHEMTVTAYSYATFAYVIPETLELNSCAESFDVKVTEYNLDVNDVIEFYITQSIDNYNVLLKNVNDETQTTQISFADSEFNSLDLIRPIASFSVGDLDDGNNTETINVNWFPAETLKAGTYSGVITFEISASSN